MKTKIISSVLAIIIAVLSYFFLTYKPITGKYPVGSCIMDRELKVKFKILKITTETYELEVIDSGHYTMSPDYQKGSQLLYLKSILETQSQYHPAFCEISNDSIPTN